MRPMPVPVATATTAVAGTGQAGSSSGGPAAASRTQRSSSTWSRRSVTRMLRGRPPAPPPPPAPLPDRAREAGPGMVGGSAGIHARLDRGADVVGVDVAVPQPLPTDDHDRVPDPRPDVLERRDRAVGRLEQVH